MRDTINPQSVIDAIADPILVIDPITFEVVLANHAAWLSAHARVSHPATCYAISHGRDTPCSDACEECPLPRVVATRALVRVAHTHFDADGAATVVDILASPVLDEEGKVVLVIESMRDITELDRAIQVLDETKELLESRVRLATKDLEASNLSLRRHIAERQQAERRLQSTERRYRLLFEMQVDAAFVTDRHSGCILNINQQAERLLGRTRPQVVGRPLGDVLGGTNELCANMRAENIPGGRVVGVEAEVVLPNARRVPVRVSSVNIDEPDQALVLCLFHDLSAIRAAEDAQRHLQGQLFQAQKLEAVGQLAGGVAHDFDNMLSVILGIASRLIRDQPDGASLVEGLRQIMLAGERASDLTTQLLAFSRQQVIEPQLLDLNTVLAQMHGMLMHAVGDGIDVDLRVKPDPVVIFADKSQIWQIMLNLVLNARDAMPGGGEIKVSTDVIALAEHVALGLPLANGEYAVLTVCDTGSGMDESIRKRIFEPFFTTKDEGRGTGLGLAVVYGIVAQSGGHVDVQSALGEGTCFSVYLPRIVSLPTPDKHPERQGTSVAAMLGEQHGEGATRHTVLVVDDEDMVRNLHARILEDVGFDVLEAHGPTAACELAAARADIEILVTDIVMPGMNGPELAEHLLGRNAALKVLFVSAYNPGGRVPSLPGTATAYLRKPFAPERLVEEVRRLLSGD